MKHLITIVLAVFFSVSHAQNIAMQVVASAGGYFESSSAGVSLSWTLGEVAYTTLTSTDYIITQGFQQGNLFSTDVEKPNLPNSDIKIYPNPATVEVFIAISTSNLRGNASVDFYDITGRKVSSEVVALEDNSPSRLSINDLKAGIYLVRVTQENTKTSRVFKLMKE